jgi:hypothetical protein
MMREDSMLRGAAAFILMLAAIVLVTGFITWIGEMDVQSEPQESGEDCFGAGCSR